MLFTLIVEQVVGEVGGERVFTVQTDLGRYCRQPKRGLASYDECSTEEGMLDVRRGPSVHLSPCCTTALLRLAS
jgi:hypothetical protein